MKTIVTRFAPSPTGLLHIGGARTALINAIFARHHQGKYLVRIEDTDRKRSTPEAIKAIKDGLEWLGLTGDAEWIFQSERLQRHQEVAEQLLAEGKAYRCKCPPEELQAMREEARAQGRTRMYDRRCRKTHVDPSLPHAVRLKVPTSGFSEIDDLVQGTVRMECDHLDDYILLRTDGSPTYMLSCVVDDADMGVTHVIRGDDHLNNAHRQRQLILAAGFPVPEYAHISLLHGEDGAKLSKRHGALGVAHYRQSGYLKEAVLNYLMRLGWGKGEEIVSFSEAVKIFDIRDLGKSPARVDFSRLKSVNAQHLLKQCQNNLDGLVETLAEFAQQSLSQANKDILSRGLPPLCERADTLHDLWAHALKYLHAPQWPLEDEKALKQFLDKAPDAGLDILLQQAPGWDFSTPEGLGQMIKAHVNALGVGFGTVGQPLRLLFCGSMQAPDIGAILFALGKGEVIKRLEHAREFLLSQGESSR